MTPWDDIMALAEGRHGAAAVRARWVTVVDAATLAARSDAQYLSALTRRVFRAGMTHAVVDRRWPAFEQAFFDFEPQKLVLMPDAMLDERLRDPALIRHGRKMASIRPNAQFMLDIAREYGSMGQLLAQWPADDTVGLWHLLSRRARSLGGRSAPAFLRMVGKDSWMPTDDVLAALTARGLVTGLSSQRDRRAAQDAINHWQQQSGLAQAHISQTLAMTVG